MESPEPSEIFQVNMIYLIEILFSIFHMMTLFLIFESMKIVDEVKI